MDNIMNKRAYSTWDISAVYIDSITLNSVVFLSPACSHTHFVTLVIRPNIEKTLYVQREPP